MKTLLRTLERVVPGARRRGHRPFGEVDAAQLRRVAKDPTRAAAQAPPVDASGNPGVRVVPEFITAEEAAAALAAANALLGELGISHVTEDLRARHAAQMAHLARPPPVNMLRLTGRDEAAAWIETAQRRAPWGYGAGFSPAALPAALRLVADRIAAAEEHFALGALRDVTINQRRHGFFRLDPHLDPAADGANVFIIGLESPTVLTVSPVHGRGAAVMDARRVALRSWAPGEDVDVLCRERSLVHLHGPARAALGHGTRLGVSSAQLRQCGVAEAVISGEGAGGEEEEEEEGGDGDSEGCDALWDWWGSVHHAVRRNPVRTSLVFAFADEDEVIDDR